MLQQRVIPCLLLKGDGLVKTVRFRDPRYVGDPINAVRLFNDLGADELVFLDVTATLEDREPDFERARALATECFMPICYGGGVRTLAQAGRLFNLGVEKVAINTAGIEAPALLGQLAREFGSQSAIVSIDVKRDFLGRARVHTHAGTKNTGLDPVLCAREMESRGAGEILLTSIDRDGTQKGYDVDLIAKVSAGVGVPVVACGGAGSVADLAQAITAGAAGAAAGSLFVFRGPHRAVLISYPTRDELRSLRGLRAGAKDVTA